MIATICKIMSSGKFSIRFAIGPVWPMAAIIPATAMVQATRHAAVRVLSVVIDLATASAIIAVMMTGKKARLQRVWDCTSGPAKTAPTMITEHTQRITVTRAKSGRRMPRSRGTIDDARRSHRQRTGKNRKRYR